MARVAVLGMMALAASGFVAFGVHLKRAADSCRAYQDRIVSFGFDDFRRSDFSMVLPIFASYGATATFNRIAGPEKHGNVADVESMTKLEALGNEIGDHTWCHWNGPFEVPLMNGQDPAVPEGGQVPFPSNDHMRKDRGDGCNAFGFALTNRVGVQLCDFLTYAYRRWTAFDTTWGELTDEQCQRIRAYHSVYANTCGMLDLFDGLSNRYLGTTGRSHGSWDADRGCYTNGIFTGCRTSANHEIWERIVELTRAVYREKYRKDFGFSTWSWPGGMNTPLFFEKDGRRYLDAACTLLANDLARFPSTRLAGPDGKPLLRSWTDVLRSAGYVMTHDALYPSCKDGTPRTMMKRQMIYNATWSRRDALAYRSEKTIDYNRIVREYADARFTNDLTTAAVEMYEAGGTYRSFVEAVRHDTAAGLMHTESIDSVDASSEAAFFDRVLAYCRNAGLRVLSKRQAFDIAFGRRFEYGNLIRNGSFRNTAAEFLRGAKSVPRNPDGYTGDCHVMKGPDGRPLLAVRGETRNLLYGVPTGMLRYSVRVRGRGTIRIRAVKNSDSLDLSTCQTLVEIPIAADELAACEASFAVPENPETAYEQRWEGLGEKIMGLEFVYSPGLFIQAPRLEKPSFTNMALSFLRLFE